MKKFLFLFLLIFLLVGCDDKTPEIDNNIDVSMVVFKSDTFIFNNTEHSIYCTNVPENVKITYIGNGVKEVGMHRVEAIITTMNDVELKRLTATIKILAHETIDVSKVVLEADRLMYDGNAHSLKCSNVPNGVSVEYIGNDVIEIGEHKVIAILKDSYGNEIKRLEAILTIIKPVPSTLEIPVLSITEDGIVSWDVVEDATHYNYIINDGEVLTTTQNYIKLEDGESISVHAACEFAISNWSNAITYFDTSEKFVDGDDTIYVKFHNTSLETLVLNGKGKISIPIAPEKEYYTFDNWYKDPYFKEVFNFNEEIVSSTIIYANYIPNELLNNTYFWVKASPLINAGVMSNPSESGWHMIPLAVNTANSSFKEFVVTVTVTNASSTNPAAFIIMDGFNDGAGRTYWKNNGADFTISSNGTYNIYFTLEKPYSENINAKFELTSNSSTTLPEQVKSTLDTPVVFVDSANKLATWGSVVDATEYEVIIDNGTVLTTTQLYIELNQGSHIVVRAKNDTKYSNWSIPKANIKTTVVDKEEDNMNSVYFAGYNSYLVDSGSSIEAPLDPFKENFTFGGWYLDIANTQKAEFPYIVTANTVFYPKWEAVSNYETKIYYNLVTSTGGYIKGLTWNLDNYTYLEYESGAVKLESGVTYYIVSVDNPEVKYGPYKVDKTSTYKLYFSEDYLWGDSNIYVEDCVKRIYFSNSKRWTDTIYAYLWNSATGEKNANWPGVAMTYLENNDYGEQIYYIDVDLTLYDSIIFLHGSSDGSTLNTQTVDISLTANKNNGFYVTDKIKVDDNKEKYQFGTYNR